MDLLQSGLTPIRLAKTRDKDQWPAKPFQPCQHYLNDSTDKTENIKLAEIEQKLLFSLSKAITK